MNQTASNSRWVKCLSTQGNIRGVAIEATDLVKELTQIHQLKGPAACGLGEAILGALLIASNCKPGERINLNIRSSGLVRQALVDAYPQGQVRGYIIPRETEEQLGVWGEGLLSVLRTKDLENRNPYIGTVPLITGHLAKDLTFYWVQSEQIPSAVGLAVEVSPITGQVTTAGGFLVQALPGASSSELQDIEKNIVNLQGLAQELSRDGDPLHLLSRIFQDTAFMVLEERPLVFQCRCSSEKVERALALVGATELQSMLEEDDSASVRCDFCTKEYFVDSAGLRNLIERANIKS